METSKELTFEERPEYIRVATNWWWDQLVSRSLSLKERITGKSDDIYFTLSERLSGIAENKYSSEEEKAFKTTLATGIAEKVGEGGKYTLDTGFGSLPNNPLLMKAASEIGGRFHEDAAMWIDVDDTRICVNVIRIGAYGMKTIYLGKKSF